jgi:hypothetical protein
MGLKRTEREPDGGSEANTIGHAKNHGDVWICQIWQVWCSEEKDLFNHMIIIPLYQRFVKLVTPCSKPQRRA